MTLLRVRATIHLHKLPVGSEALVDPADAYVRACLRKGALVPVASDGAGTLPAMTEVGKPLEEPVVEILPREDPVPRQVPVPVGPGEEPVEDD